VSGRVQGVGYRFFADEAAHVEGLSGWIRNLPDGRVEALAEGDLEAVERFGRQLARGPGGARVDRIDIVEEAPDGRVRRFEIRG
jgi:acylphosphatase